ncbi:dipeptidyl aminopeptidase/acylaminoacyl peptidase [Roseateles asaccharophilus]|uniref:Dipeptidyl aminopeptidase/acylaminoacyl peptidase n=1 Tax=Roseateles asaccharophilus TaxID=582607 RepID=A0ABU2AD35_9BURK|nr:dipeptidyl aminopeptidase/acylaminoacyl peptidase [Roseateles asaccharophilus]
MHQAARINAPLLLPYGAEDLRVPKDHGRSLRDAMTKAGNAPEYVEYENEGHGWQQMSARLDFAKRVETFLGKHLQPAAP